MNEDERREIEKAANERFWDSFENRPMWVDKIAEYGAGLIIVGLVILIVVGLFVLTKSML